MVSIKKAIILLLAFISILNQAIACDDTLVLLLTAQNPGSEFSRIIRNFNANLTELGLALNTKNEKAIPENLKAVMDAWLDFTQKYSVNPPSEAKNDLNWANKMRKTGQAIGKIRKMIKNQQIVEAHDSVLALSGTIGGFFEAFGVSSEKQLFIKASTNLTQLEQYLLRKDYKQVDSLIIKLKEDLANFKAYLPENEKSSFARTQKLLAEIGENTSDTKNYEKLELLKTGFNELRSHILMKEWFPGLAEPNQQGEKDAKSNSN